MSPCKSKGCKVTVRQTLKLFHCPGLEPGPPARGSTMAEWQNFFSNLQLWQLVTLQSFVLQRPTVSLWKGLSLIKNILSIQKVGRIFDIGFALSKWPHLHRPYVVGGCLFNLGTVTVSQTTCQPVTPWSATSKASLRSKNQTFIWLKKGLNKTLYIKYHF